jgi:quinoprotein glucose dehydrogenase
MKAAIFLGICALAFAADKGEWTSHSHDPGGQSFSPLKAINRSNVTSLKIAWTFRTGDAYLPKHGKPTAFEATPLYVEGTLYLGTPLGRILALDPVTGKERWAYDPHVVDKDAGWGDNANRGVSTWKSPDGKRRIYIATIDAHLIAVDATTGKPCPEFGDNGMINLRTGLRIPPRAGRYADYEETSPPAVIGNTLIAGSAIADNNGTDQPSGEVRAFDTVTGKLKWKWDPMPNYPKTGAGNAWSIIATDPERNLVFVPTGSASPDYYGGERLGDDLYANSVVALRADTGEMVWHFQTVHHDLWDYDVATPPVLFDIQRNGAKLPAIAVGSKTGNVFILNRETGKPIFGVEERPVPKSDVPGEVAAATQPFPLKPAPITAQQVSVDDAWGVDDADRQWCRAEISKLRTGPIFSPPSLQGSLFLPGNVGGMNWGGFSYDAAHGLLLLASNRLAAEVRLIPRAEFDARESEGRKMNGDWEFAHQTGTPFGMMRRFLLSPKGVPCTAPPWGTLIAIAASTGEKKWEVPLGRLSSKLSEKWGSISLGGPISTAGGLVFVAGTLDAAIYAFDIETGKQLWRGELPTSARAMPMTYRGPDGKQYVVICAGGHGIPDRAPLADYVIAFSL